MNLGRQQSGIFDPLGTLVFINEVLESKSVLDVLSILSRDALEKVLVEVYLVERGLDLGVLLSDLLYAAAHQTAVLNKLLLQ